MTDETKIVMLESEVARLQARVAELEHGLAPVLFGLDAPPASLTEEEFRSAVQRIYDQWDQRVRELYG